MKTAVLLPMVVAAQLYSQDSSEVRTPRKALTYSLIPGGGQLYNGKPLKAALMMGAQLGMLYQFSTNRSQYNNWESGDPNPREQYRDNRNKYAWYSAFVYIYNLADALVDSHLAGFDEKEELEAEDKTEQKGD